jgi:hypothetical protein
VNRFTVERSICLPPLYGRLLISPLSIRDVRPAKTQYPPRAMRECSKLA